MPTSKTEIYGYNVIADQDMDILNQGSSKHIIKYFDKKQKEAENQNTTVSQSLLTNVNKTKELNPNAVSINSRGFVIKFICVILFLYILRDFIKNS